MGARYFLTFPGTSDPEQEIAPATFPVLIRHEVLVPARNEPQPRWKASGEDGRGLVTDSEGAAYGTGSLEGLVGMLAAAGFRKVSVDMGSVPLPAVAPCDAEPIPF